jgi:hypothetical protein
MKISLRVIRGIKLLVGSPLLKGDGLPRYASTVTPRRRPDAADFSSRARDGASETMR